MGSVGQPDSSGSVPKSRYIYYMFLCDIYFAIRNIVILINFVTL